MNDEFVKIKLEKRLYDLLKTVDWSELQGSIWFNDNENEFITSNFELFQLILSEAIVSKGFVNDLPTEYGRQLEELYDTIYYTA